MDVRVSLVEHASEVDADAWDRLAGDDDFYLSWGALGAATSQFAGTSQFVVAHAGHELVGAFPLYQVRLDPNPAYALERLSARFGTSRRVLLGGAPRGYRNGMLVRRALTTEATGHVVRAIGAGALRAARSSAQSGIVVPYLTTAGLVTLQRGSDPLVVLESAEADLIGVDSLRSLRECLSRDRRSMVQREMAAFSSAGWRIRASRLRDHLGLVARLVANVQGKHGINADVRAIQRELALQDRLLGERTSLLLATDSDGVVAGCSVFFLWRERLYARVVGLDYSVLRRGYEYFNLLFYGPLQESWPSPIARIHLGTGSLFAKAMRGATLRPLWTALLLAGPRTSFHQPEGRDAALKILGDAARLSHAVNTDDWPMLN